ncbi:MAG: D-alanyl-D-alanine carboxypeptidase [Clostridiaceae bacterium]|nr:D-alanyl-D-alanine carboxypeptidase [Clostridiaceae bacterium]
MSIIIRNLSKYLILLLTVFFLLQIISAAAVFADNFEDVPGWPAIEDIRASAYSVYNATTDEFILEHNVHQPLWNASTTKVLTALTAVRHEKFDLDAKLLVSEAATYFGDPASAKLNLKAGELISTRDVLGGLMVMSANDCAYVLAENYGGLYGYTSDLSPDQWGNFSADAAVNSRQAFVAEMNRVAKSLGTKNTNFDNPCGWDGENHHTTAYDLTMMSKALLENDVLADFAVMAHYMPEPTNMHPYGAWSMTSNTNSLVVYGTNFFQSQYIARYNGVKTGTTPLAGNCLIGAGITHHGQQIIAVILDGSVYRSEDNSYVNLALPVRTLLEYGAYISGSDSKPYQEAALPVFPPIPNPDLTEPTETLPAESDISTENIPDQTSEPTSTANPMSNQQTKTENPQGSEGPAATSGITRREWMVIALSALIVVCVIGILIVNIISNRKGRKDPDEK